MRTVLDLVIAVVATVAQLTAGLVASSPPDDGGRVEAPIVAEASEIELVGVPDEQAEVVAWAVARYEEAGLRLPPLRFVSHGDDREPCSGYRGIHQVVDGVSQIGFCTTEVGPAAEWMVLHELGHAWLEHELTPEREAEFRAVRGYEHWRDRETSAWHENGCEQAAEILAWGVIDRPAGVVTILDHGCDALEAGYRALTGTAPLHGFRDRC